MRSITLFALLIALVACKKDEPQKKTPEELITLLSRTGAAIRKDGAYDNEPPAEMNMKLIVDGEEGVTARRFPTMDLARDYCQTQQACFTVEHWSVKTWESRAASPAWAKLLAAAGKPAPAVSSPKGATSQPPEESKLPECVALRACCADREKQPNSVQLVCISHKKPSECADHLRAVLGFYAEAKTPTPHGCELPK